MTIDDLMTLAAGARAAMADPRRSHLVGGATAPHSLQNSPPRFELFHAASSLCSQKVRTVLAEKALPYRSNDMMILSAIQGDRIVPAEHYSPAYVRLRLHAGREIGKPFVDRYTGRTSVETEGFDPCVVPLLIDYEAGRVIADSLRICSYLDGLSPAPVRLIPDDGAARDAVMRQAGIVDRIPNGALLYGFHPDADRRPAALRAVMETVYDAKILALEAMIDANADDAGLADAYRAKILKERGGKAVSHDARFQRQTREHVAALLRDLECTLPSAGAPWVTGANFSLADVFWGVNLTRLAYLGLASMWNDLPLVARYVEALVRRPSIAEEVVQATIESLPPSAYMDVLTGGTRMTLA
ncbi:glutathione S-transferase family protein [Cupriavidus pauculus]|uniref:Glutathione S-transferase family protein n=1 Tax=Cupriavidus pauculus TaxID=82633 RepID=A0A5P2H225_9BURK|nr:glutathione S-transferase family protein [Cupriavidus pauculus]QET01818.1 glutathione S-transferase family protein [Cupriavidus pauculus]